MATQDVTGRVTIMPAMPGDSGNNESREFWNVSSDIQEILDYWKVDPVCNTGRTLVQNNSPRMVGQNQKLNQIPAAAVEKTTMFSPSTTTKQCDRDIKCEPCDWEDPLWIKGLAVRDSQVSLMGGEVTNNNQTGSLTFSPMTEEEEQSLGPEKEFVRTQIKVEKYERDIPAPQCKTEIKSECLEDLILTRYFAEQESTLAKMQRETCVKSEPFGNETGEVNIGPSTSGYTSLNRKNCVEQNSAYNQNKLLPVKGEDPIWAHYYATAREENYQPRARAELKPPLYLSFKREDCIPVNPGTLLLRGAKKENPGRKRKPSESEETSSSEAEYLTDSPPQTDTSRGTRANVHKTFNTCPLCGESIYSHQEKVGLENQQKAENGKVKPKNDSTWRCCKCKNTLSAARLEAHMKIHIDTGIKCPECGKFFISQYHLKKHIATHSKETPFSCKDCGRAYRLIGQLNGHIQSVHVKNHICQECGACFAQKATLEIHMNMHTGNRPFKCSKCDAAFKSPGHVKTHQMKHTDERPFSCSKCTSRFKSKEYLQSHKERHCRGSQLESRRQKILGKKMERSESEETSSSEATSLREYLTDSRLAIDWRYALAISSCDMVPALAIVSQLGPATRLPV